jgi:cytochrome c-type biogenesis protein
MKIGIDARKLSWIKSLGEFKSFILGMIFATAWSPCIGPVLGAILTLAAIEATIWKGAMLLFFYSLGLSIPFFLFSISMAQIPLIFRLISRFNRLISYSSALVLFVFGFLLFNNTVGWFSQSLTYNVLQAYVFRAFTYFGYKVH